jgi:uncharacterized protein YkwD
MVLLSIMLAFGVLVHRPGPADAAASDDLYAAINTYRQGLGLTAVPLSPQLTAVAQAHVRDLIANFTTDPNYTGAGCNPHGWSSQGQWTGGCYKSDDATTYQIMWSKPGEIANYPGNGFEILFGGIGTPATAAGALQAWQASPAHNDVIVNQGIWSTHPWQAIGVWVEAGWAAVWFGEEADPNATQPTTAQTGPAPAAQVNLPAGPNVPGNEPAGANGAATAPAATAPTTPAGTTNGNQTAGAAAIPTCVDAEEAEFLTLINAYRAENGLKPLTLSPTLSAAANAHSEDMAAKNYFDHTGLDGSTFDQRITAAGHTVSNATGENIFAGDERASGALTSWKNSPPHNASMLSPTFTAIGIGRAFDANSDFKWYWTTTFGDTVDSGCGGPVAAGQQAGNGTTGTGQQAGNGTTGTGPANPAAAGGNDAGAGAGNATTASDRDGDGLSDQVEAGIHGTDPGVFDTDGGGVGDGQEVTDRTNPLDPSDDRGGPGAQNNNNADDADGDGDGISDADETDFFGTDPDQFDTDGGGVGDGDELFNGTDPFDPNDDTGGDVAGAGLDTDGDGISDEDETDFFGTDPQSFDTDGDGFSDSDELFNGTDPLDPTDS